MTLTDVVMKLLTLLLVTTVLRCMLFWMHETQVYEPASLSGLMLKPCVGNEQIVCCTKFKQASAIILNLIRHERTIDGFPMWRKVTNGKH